MIDGHNLRRIPMGESRRLFARMLGRAGNMWMGVGTMTRGQELTVDWDDDARVLDPAWELATGRWQDGDRERVEFGLLDGGRVVRIAWCHLTGWAVRASRRTR